MALEDIHRLVGERVAARLVDSWVLLLLRRHGRVVLRR